MLEARPASSPSRRLLDLIFVLHMRSGYQPADWDPAVEYSRLSWEFDSGQWVMATGANGELLGWLSFYRVSPVLLEDLRHESMADRMRGGSANRDFTQGPCLYVSSTVIAPSAPHRTLYQLYRLAKKHNPTAISISAHLRDRRGHTAWFHRT